MTGRPRTASDDAIFAAVTMVMSESGAEGVTLAAIAKRVGVTAPALTQRYGSKRGLLVAYSEHESNDIDALFDRIEQQFSDPKAAIVEGLCRLASPLNSRRSVANNLSFLQMDIVDDQLRAHAAEQGRRVRLRISRLLQASAADGSSHLQEFDTVAIQLHALYNGTILLWAIDGQLPLGSTMRTAVELFLTIAERPPQ